MEFAHSNEIIIMKTDSPLTLSSECICHLHTSALEVEHSPLEDDRKVMSTIMTRITGCILLTGDYGNKGMGK